MIIPATLVLAAGCFVFDLLTPLGAGEWGLYLVPLLFSFRARQSWYPFLFSGVASGLVAVGFWLAPHGIEPLWSAVNRILGIGVLWLTAVLLVQRKHAVHALRDNEQRLQAILDHSPCEVFVKDLSGRYTEFNRQCELSTGKTRAEVIGHTDPELFTPELSDEFRASDQAALAAGDAVQVQMKIPAGDGTRTLLVIKFPLLDLQGKCHAVCGISADITEQMQAREALRQSVTEREQKESVLKQTKEQLQTLSRRLLEMQETERRHIARELHDEIGQALTALKINLQAVQRLSGADAFFPRLLDSINIVDRTLRQVRNLSLDLRPSMLDDLGLCAALRWYSDQQAQRTGLRIQFIAQSLEGRLDPPLETTCFRVVQEALTNIVRHAQANSVFVELAERDASLHLNIRDDGIGFDLEAVHRRLAGGASTGLLGMKERVFLIGGKIEFKSTHGHGTEVHAWFPMPQLAVDPRPALDLIPL